MPWKDLRSIVFPRDILLVLFRWSDGYRESLRLLTDSSKRRFDFSSKVFDYSSKISAPVVLSYSEVTILGKV